MPRRPPDPERLREIDAAVATWRQGDVSFGPKVLASVADFRLPLTPESAEAEDAPDEVAVLPVEFEHGVVVLTQTCDIVRECTDRAYVHVAPVQEVSEQESAQVERGYHPQFARIPLISRLVADLDRITTVEKSVLAQWTRTEGCSTDAQRRAFARALARKDARFAFPDEFAAAIARLRARILEKHDRGSLEGAALRDHLLEIRVTAEPDWDAAQVSAFLTFVRKDSVEAASVQWAEFLPKWLGLCEGAGRIVRIDGTVMTLSEMSAQEYVDSDPLDLGHLSLRGKQA